VEEVDIPWSIEILDGAVANLDLLFGGSLAELVDSDPVFSAFARPKSPFDQNSKQGFPNFGP
jgi:hypothetical protein